MIDTGLAGQTVLVTGGSGNIGAAISRAFAAQGARVAVHHLDRDPPAPAGTAWAHITPAAQVAAALAEELGNGSFAVSADLSEPDGAVRLAREVADRAGAVNVLVNNAAHCESPDTVDTLTHASLERHYRVNAIAPAVLIAEAARLRRGGEPLCAVNVTTDAARAFPGQTGYRGLPGRVRAAPRARHPGRRCAQESVSGARMASAIQE